MECFIFVQTKTLESLYKIDREVAKKHKCDLKVFFALLEDVIYSKKEMTFHSADKRTFKVS